MTYEESSALMQGQAFRGRCYADSIMIEAPTVPAHNARFKWAQGAFAQPDLVAMQVQPPTVMDPGVQSAGAAVTDAALQGAVEAVVNKMI